MNQDKLNEMIEEWEQTGCEVVRTIDTHEDTVERIVKIEGMYYLYRYFTLLCNDDIRVSVDLNCVDADQVIQHLAERL